METKELETEIELCPYLNECESKRGNNCITNYKDYMVYNWYQEMLK